MEEAARLRALSTQTWQQAAQQYDRVFREVVGMRPVQPSLSTGVSPEFLER
jgi:hypothetical protein